MEIKKKNQNANFPSSFKTQGDRFYGVIYNCDRITTSTICVEYLVILAKGSQIKTLIANILDIFFNLKKVLDQSSHQSDESKVKAYNLNI